MTNARATLDNRLSEKQFQQQVVDLAKTCGWDVYHTHNSQFSESGFPDLTMVRKGRLVFAELKREDKKSKPTEEQLRWLDELGAVPCAKAFLWRPSDFPQIIKELN